MRHRIPSNPINAPRTTMELLGYEISSYEKESKYGKAILCSKCGLSGGTLVKDGKGGYCHSDNDIKCKLLQDRKKA